MKDVGHFTIATTVNKVDRHRQKNRPQVQGGVKLADISFARATFVPFVN